MSPANDEILYRVTRRPLLAIVVGGWGNKLPRPLVLELLGGAV
jgi:hypothetical protein